MQPSPLKRLHNQTGFRADSTNLLLKILFVVDGILQQLCNSNRNGIAFIIRPIVLLSNVLFLCGGNFVLGCTCALTGRSTKTPGGGFLSSVAFVGILKKAVIMLVVLLSVQLDGVIGGKAMFQSAAIFFYIANEGLSILENCALMDVPVPKPLRDALEALKNKGNDAGQSDDGGDENP